MTETEYDAHRRRVNAMDRDAHHAAYAAEHGATALLPPWWLTVEHYEYGTDPATGRLLPGTPRTPRTPRRGTLELVHPPLWLDMRGQPPVRPEEVPAGTLLAVRDRWSSQVMLVRTVGRLGQVTLGPVEEGEIDGGGDELDDDWMAVRVRERRRTQSAYVEILHVDESR